jgi:hypothetical protein
MLVSLDFLRTALVVLFRHSLEPVEGSVARNGKLINA